MKKKLLLLIPIIFLLVLVGLVFYWNPPTTPVSISLNTFKIDRNCNQKGTVAIDLTGEWIHPYFEEKRLDITSNAFDGMTNLEVGGSTTDRFPGDAPEQLPGVPFLRCWGGMFHKAKNQYELCDVVFSPDYERWMLGFRSNNVFYLGSTNSEDTLEDLYEYFMPMIIGSWSGDPYEKDQYFGLWVTTDGKISDPVDLFLNVDIEKTEDNRDVLKLYFKLPDDFPYTFTKDANYYDGSNGIVPYYVATGYALSKVTNEPELFHFAYDKEKNCSIFVWEDSPEQYLLISGKPQFDSKEIIEHFKAFLDLLPYDE